MPLLETFAYATAAGTGITQILSRINAIAISVSAVVISLLWIPIAFQFFSSDENRRMIARTRLRNAAIGTFIYLLAVSGLLYAIFNYVITGS